MRVHHKPLCTAPPRCRGWGEPQVASAVQPEAPWDSPTGIYRTLRSETPAVAQPEPRPSHVAWGGEALPAHAQLAGSPHAGSAIGERRTHHGPSTLSLSVSLCLSLSLSLSLSDNLHIRVANKKPARSKCGHKSGGDSTFTQGPAWSLKRPPCSQRRAGSRHACVGIEHYTCAQSHRGRSSSCCVRS